MTISYLMPKVIRDQNKSESNGKFRSIFNGLQNLLQKSTSYLKNIKEKYFPSYSIDYSQINELYHDLRFFDRFDLPEDHKRVFQVTSSVLYSMLPKKTYNKQKDDSTPKKSKRDIKKETYNAEELSVFNDQWVHYLEDLEKNESSLQSLKYSIKENILKYMKSFYKGKQGKKYKSRLIDNTQELINTTLEEKVKLKGLNGNLAKEPKEDYVTGLQNILLAYSAGVPKNELRILTGFNKSDLNELIRIYIRKPDLRRRFSGAGRNIVPSSEDMYKLVYDLWSKQNEDGTFTYTLKEIAEKIPKISEQILQEHFEDNELVKILTPRKVSVSTVNRMRKAYQEFTGNPIFNRRELRKQVEEEQLRKVQSIGKVKITYLLPISTTRVSVCN